jgi:hypothetical protein
MPARFGDFSGTVAQLLAHIAATRQRPFSPEDAQFADLAPPFGLAYEAPLGPRRVLRDTHDEPVRLGERLFLLGECELTCFDAGAPDYEDGKRWTFQLPPPAPTAQRVGQLTSDGRRLALLDGHVLTLLDALSGKPSYQRRLDWLGPRGWIRAAGSGDWLAVSDDKGQVSALKLTDGQTVWRARLLLSEWGQLTAWDELLLAYEKGRGPGVCCDLRTGRVLTELPQRGAKGLFAAALLTPEGLIVTLGADGTLTIQDVRLAGLSQARAVNLGSGEWRALASGRRFVGFRSSAGDGRVCVLDLADPARLIGLEVGDEPAGAQQPVCLIFHEDRAVLLYGRLSPGGELTAAGLAAFSLPEGTRLWKRPLAPPTTGPCRVTRLDRWGDVLSLALEGRDGAQSLRPCLVRTTDGELFDCAGVMNAELRGGGADTRPVALNGRALVFHAGGVACLVSLKP